MNLQIFMPPLIGSLIGYITNDIAIKMLFHPRKAIYIGKWRLPFTPGLIPREKHRIAKSIGKVVGAQLLDADTMAEVLTSENMRLKLRASLERIVENNKENHSTLEETILKPEAVRQIIEDIKHDIASQMRDKLSNLNIGETISASNLNKIMEKLGNSMFGFMKNLLDESLIDSIVKGIGDAIDKAVSENAEQIIQDILDNEIEKLKRTEICAVIAKYEEKIPMIIDFIINMYEKAIRKNLARILDRINIEKIVKEKIDYFDVIQVEDMIFGIMNKELKAIVYLGALLGFILGWFNILISAL